MTVRTLTKVPWKYTAVHDKKRTMEGKARAVLPTHRTAHIARISSTSAAGSTDTRTHARHEKQHNPYRKDLTHAYSQGRDRSLCTTLELPHNSYRKECTHEYSKQKREALHYPRPFTNPSPKDELRFGTKCHIQTDQAAPRPI